MKQESFRMEVLMKNLQSECFNQCVKTLGSDELVIDEVNCLDKCAWKYLAVDRILNAALERGAAQPGDVKKRR